MEKELLYGEEEEPDEEVLKSHGFILPKLIHSGREIHRHILDAERAGHHVPLAYGLEEVEASMYILEDTNLRWHGNTSRERLAELQTSIFGGLA